MSASWDWPGSRWWRVDLHSHSPASLDFRSESDCTTPNWEGWIQAARDAGLQAVAITDHNTAKAVEALKQAAATVENAPILFPGVEITASDGTHILLVLDPHCTRDHVNGLLTLAKVPVDQRGKREARSTLSVEGILKLALRDRVVCIGAHVNGQSGLLKLTGQTRIAVLKHPGLAAVEIDPDTELDEAWIDGSRGETKRELSRIWSSDSHSFDQAGRRFTWIKMTRPNAEGLRLALLDGSDSLKPARKDDEDDPNQHPDLAIESIKVQQAQYMGRSEPLTVRFNPWLNAIIGGRGTGKSTLIDICRKTLRRDEELPDKEASSLRAVFDRRMRAPASRGDEGLLTAKTVVEVVYRKSGERFVLRWDPQGQEQPIERLEGDRRIPEEGRIRERFPVRIYSQKQLFELATRPNALLTVIDDAAEVDGAAWQRKRKESKARYLSLRAGARDLQAQAADLPDRKAALSDVRRKIAVLEKGGNAKALNEYRTRRNQESTWQSVQSTAVSGVDAVEEAGRELAVSDLSLSADASEDEALAALERTHESLRTTVQDLQQSVLAAVKKARLEIRALRDGADTRAWREAVEASEKAFQQVSQQLAEAGIANPDEYRDLLQRATTLELEIASLKQHRETATKREEEATAALKRYRRLREEHGEVRKSFTAKTSGDLIRVAIRVNAVCDTLDPFLREALGIARFDEDYRLLREKVTLEDGEAWSFDRLDELVSELRELLADPEKERAAADRRFVTALRRLQPERLDRLALYLPDDAVDVEFRGPRDCEKAWKKLAQGSPGQKTAALLAFVLGYGDEPILLDQPEDDLDNTLIYELLVQRLRDTKATRQVIVVTHNPNIVVHGDAELVVSLEAAGGQTRIVFAGGLQEQKGREEICRVMEGGRAAFEARYRRIMPRGGQDHV